MKIKIIYKELENGDWQEYEYTRFKCGGWSMKPITIHPAATFEPFFSSWFTMPRLLIEKDGTIYYLNFLYGIKGGEKHENYENLKRNWARWLLISGAYARKLYIK